MTKAATRLVDIAAAAALAGIAIIVVRIGGPPG